MSGVALPSDRTPAAPAPGRVGQATAVEQSRAVAEVQAAVIVAQQCPRSTSAARASMIESCEQLAFAERAFYRFPRAGGTVSGPSVYFARELARCWGNVQYGVNELRRDDEAGQSEMQAWAWDVQTNSRSSTTFIVPHMRDKKGGPERLVDLRDVYENNANMGARRLRECVLSILPTWFIEEAKELCTKRVAAGDGKPLDERVARAVAVFDGLGVVVDQLEQKLGRPKAQWTEFDIAQLLVTHRSISRAEIAVDDEFPARRVTAAEVAAAPKTPTNDEAAAPGSATAPTPKGTTP